MCYSIEPKDRIYVKGYGFLLFSKNIDKNLNDKYSQKFLDSGKKIYSRCKKTYFKESNSKNSRSNSTKFFEDWWEMRMK